MASVSKRAATRAAQIAGEDPAMDRKAASVAQAVRAVAARHRDSGEFLNSIQTKSDVRKRKVRDRVVYSDDPAAISKEFGHTVKTRAGEKFVPGMHAFSTALQQET